MKDIAIIRAKIVKELHTLLRSLDIANGLIKLPL
jgi:hypothetical protein